MLALVLLVVQELELPIFGVIIKYFQAIIDRCEIEGAGGIYIFLLKLLQLLYVMILDLLLFGSVVLGSLAVSREDDPFLLG